MRANEFITERQRVDEIVPFVLGGLTALGIGMQGYETYKDIRDYQTGKIDKKELTRRIGTDAAIAVVGGAIGKGVAGLYGAGKAGFNVFKNAMKHKDKAKDATDTVTKTKPKPDTTTQTPKGDATDAVPTTPKPGSVIQTPKGPRVAGVDGKPTVINPNTPGAKKDIAIIKQKAKKQPDTDKAGAAASAATKKADDVVKKPGTGKAGASATTVATKSKNFLKKPIVRGAGLAALANQTTGAGDSISNAAGQSQTATSGSDGSGKDTGPVFYTGFRKGPPKKVVSLKDRPGV